MNDAILDKIAAEYAADIMRECNDYGGSYYDMAHEYADGSEHVIYYSKAHAICQNCDTSNGEQFLEDNGNPETVTYDTLATAIAYGELLARINAAIDEIETASAA